MVTPNDLIQVQSQRSELSVILAARWEPKADLTVWFHRVLEGSPEEEFLGPHLTAERGLKH